MSAYKKITGLLLETGLSEAEVSIYKELLKEPVGVAYDLVNKTGLSKSTVYRAVISLKNRGIIKEKDKVLKPASLKTLIASLKNSGRKLGKIADQLQKISPFLSLPQESIEEFEHYYGRENVIEQYLDMAQRDYSINLDFGDFENFIPRIGGIESGNKFRNYRIKHASHYAICTTFGPNTAYYSTREAEKEFKNKVKILDIDFENKFVIFSDTGDHALFINSDEEDDIEAILVKSKVVADLQRSQFHIFSQKLGNL